MTLKEKILNDLKLAMKEGNSVKRDTLRMIDSMIKNTEIEKKKKEEGLNDEEMMEVFNRAIKQRRDSIVQYEKAGREDLAEKEISEIEILSAYMPKQLEEDDVKKIVKEIISQVGASSPQEIGKVMGPAMGKLKGRANGDLVRKIVEGELK